MNQSFQGNDRMKRKSNRTETPGDDGEMKIQNTESLSLFDNPQVYAHFADAACYVHKGQALFFLPRNRFLQNSPPLPLVTHHTFESGTKKTIRVSQEKDMLPVPRVLVTIPDNIDLEMVDCVVLKREVLEENPVQFERPLSSDCENVACSTHNTGVEVQIKVAQPEVDMSSYGHIETDHFSSFGSSVHSVIVEYEYPPLSFTDTSRSLRFLGIPCEFLSGQEYKFMEDANHVGEFVNPTKALGVFHPCPSIVLRISLPVTKLKGVYYTFARVPATGMTATDVYHPSLFHPGIEVYDVSDLGFSDMRKFFQMLDFFCTQAEARRYPKGLILPVSYHTVNIRENHLDFKYTNDFHEEIVEGRSTSPIHPSRDPPNDMSRHLKLIAFKWTVSCLCEVPRERYEQYQSSLQFVEQMGLDSLKSFDNPVTVTGLRDFTYLRADSIVFIPPFEEQFVCAECVKSTLVGTPNAKKAFHVDAFKLEKLIISAVETSILRDLVHQDMKYIRMSYKEQARKLLIDNPGITKHMKTVHVQYHHPC